MLPAVVALLLLVPAAAQAPARAPHPSAPWQPLAGTLPDGITAWRAELPGHLQGWAGPVRAWVVIVAPRDGIVVRNLVSDVEPAAKEPLVDLAVRNGAVAAINTTYFDTKAVPCRVAGWLVAGGRQLAPPTLQVTRAHERRTTTVAVARAGFAIDGNGAWRFGWVAAADQDVIRLLAPLRSEPEAAATDRSDWGRPREAFSAGPMLWLAGRRQVTRAEEQLFVSSDDRHPRTALGRTGDGRLVMLVADGRYKDQRSVGLTLEQLADVMRDLGCVDALNLDGGGSSTLVIDGELINRPEGGTFQRPVPAGLGVFATGWKPTSRPATQPASRPGSTR